MMNRRNENKGNRIRMRAFVLDTNAPQAVFAYSLIKVAKK